MTPIVRQLSGIKGYRFASGFLVGSMVLLPLALVRMGTPDWVAVLTTLPIYATLVFLTFARLKDAGLSGWWIILLILMLNFGPRWEGLEPFTFYASQLLHLIPIALGWFVQPARAVGLMLRDPAPDGR